MADGAKKQHISVGLLAHVGANRREPHFCSYLPGPKTGEVSYPAEIKLFQGLKIPPYVVFLHRGISTTYGGQKSEFGFTSVFRAEND